MFKKLKYVVAAALSGSLLTAAPALASHTWGGYHWARTTNPFVLSLGDNVSYTWDSYLSTAATDWSKSAVLDTRVVTGKSYYPSMCQPTSGRVEICNASYGQNGWLGLGSVWTSGGHITQATVKMNDTYFNMAAYNKPSWRTSVMCQEIGHTLGLQHQDENYYNAPLGSCMDYTIDPTPNMHPNQHDYDQLAAIYAHLDSTSTIAAPSRYYYYYSSQPQKGENGDWGRQVRRQGRNAVFVKEYPNDQKLFTFVIYAQ